MKKTIFIFSLVFVFFATAVIYHLTQKADINYYQGRRNFEKGRYDKAVPLYQQALKADPQRLEALTGLGYSYQWIGRKEEAIGAFTNALAVKAKDSNNKLDDASTYQLKIALAQTYSWAKEYDKAIKLYKEIIQTADSVDLEKELAEVYIWDKQFSQAKEILEPLVKNNPKDAQLKLLLAKAMQYSGDVKKAIMLYEELLKEKAEEEKGP